MNLGILRNVEHPKLSFLALKKSSNTFYGYYLGAGSLIKISLFDTIIL